MVGSQELEIANIVGSGKFDVELDLAPIAEDLSKLEEWFTEVEHSRREGNRLLIYFVGNDALGILAPTGVYVFTGVSTFEEIENAKKKLLKGLSSLGIVSGVEPPETEIIDEFAIQNLVCTADVGKELNLNAISIGLGLEKTEYEPEQFPGLVYKPVGSNCTLLIFSTGKVVITGVKTIRVAKNEFENLIEKLEELGFI